MQIQQEFLEAANSPKILICRRCGTAVSADDMVSSEGDTDIYRCGGCRKPVQVSNGKVRGITQGG